MTREECIALLDRYANYNGMGIPNLAGCKEAMKKAVELLSAKPSEDLEKYASRAGFDYVDDIESKYPNHRWNDHDVEFAYRDGIIAGAKWQKEQMEKNRLVHCDSLTKEEYDIETAFADEIIEKENRTPTFIDAIKYGMKLQKEQMMTNEEMKCALRMEYEKGVFDTKQQMLKEAVERTVKIDSGGYPYIDITAELYDYGHDVPLAKEGDLVKIIIVKEGEE